MKSLTMLLLFLFVLGLGSCAGGGDGGTEEEAPVETDQTSAKAPVIDELKGNGSESDIVRDGLIVLGRNFTEDMKVFLVPAEGFYLTQYDENAIDLETEFDSDGEVLALLNRSVKADVRYKLFVQNDDGEDSEDITFFKGEKGDPGESFVWDGTWDPSWDKPWEDDLNTAVEDASCTDEDGNWICGAYWENSEDWQTFEEAAEGANCYDDNFNWICAGPAPWDQDLAGLDTGCYDAKGNWDKVSCGPEPWLDDLADIPPGCFDDNNNWICEGPAPGEITEFHVLPPPPDVLDVWKAYYNAPDKPAYGYNIIAIDPKLDPVAPPKRQDPFNFLGNVPREDLKFTITTAPEGLTIDRKGTVKWEPSEDQVGQEFEVNIKVSNLVTRDTADLLYWVRVIDPSKGFSIVSEPEYFTGVGWNWIYYVEIFDPDNDWVWIDGENYVLEVSVVHPNYLDQNDHPLINENDDTGSWSWGQMSFTPYENDLGGHDITVAVRKYENSIEVANASRVFTLNVVENYQGLSEGLAFITWPNWFAVKDEGFEYEARAFDPSAPEARYNYTVVSGPDGMLFQGNFLKWNTTGFADTGVSVTIKATDKLDPKKSLNQEFWLEVLAEAPRNFDSWTSCEVLNVCFDLNYNAENYDTPQAACDYIAIKQTDDLNATGVIPSDWGCDWSRIVAACSLGYESVGELQFYQNFYDTTPDNETAAAQKCADTYGGEYWSYSYYPEYGGDLTDDLGGGDVSDVIGGVTWFGNPAGDVLHGSSTDAGISCIEFYDVGQFFDPSSIYTPYNAGFVCDRTGFVAGCYTYDSGRTSIRYYFDQPTATNAQINCGDDLGEVWFTDLTNLP